MGMQKLLEGWIKINPGFQIATCAEDIDLKQYSITHNKCVDDELIAKIFVKDENLMNFTGLKSKDKLLFGEEVTIKKHSLKDKVPGDFISNPHKKSCSEKEQLFL